MLLVVEVYLHQDMEMVAPADLDLEKLVVVAEAPVLLPSQLHIL
jgi:hypothetical protein